MRFFEFNLHESSRGILFRTVGDPFKSTADPNKTLTYAGSQTFPAPVPGQGAAQFPDPETFNQEVAAAEKKFPGITWTNKSSASMRAFAVVTLDDPVAKKKVHFGRFFKEISPDMAGKWKNDGIPGYSLEIKSSKKSRSGLKPNDLIPLGQQFPNPQALIEALKPDLDPAIKAGLTMIVEKKLPVFNVDASMEAAIRDDLGEIIAPMALWQGMISAEAESARKFLLKTTPWSACAITFSSTKNAGLIDSYVKPPKGVAVGISSKGAEGAKASASNIWAGVELLRSTGQQDVVDQYPEAVHVLEVIKRESQYRGPMVLGTEYGFLTGQDETLINQAIKQGMQKLPPGPEWENIGALMKKFAPRDMSKSNYNIGYHALAGLAKMVQEKVNSSVPKFSEACITFLNSSPLLQIHLYTKASGNTVSVTGFKTIWPPQFKGSVSLNAGKSYYATGVINKFAFSW